MAEKLTRGEKAAKTLTAKNPRHFKELGAEGGKKTPGTFKTKRGLAKRAGQRSGMVRRLNGLAKQIHELRVAIDHLADAQSERAQLSEKLTEYEKLRIEINGGGYVETSDGVIMEYHQ